MCSIPCRAYRILCSAVEKQQTRYRTTVRRRNSVLLEEAVGQMT